MMIITSSKKKKKAAKFNRIRSNRSLEIPISFENIMLKNNTLGGDKHCEAMYFK